ncbi:MAG: cellulase family glycosylhydrolase [Chloroflexi bacterium]|nr:cellulase family glycosylhydrolase [Chloroflexota bacterium]
MSIQLSSKRTRWLIGGVFVCIVLVALLALDLRSHGLIWNGLWWLTGEETPLAQVRGLVEYLGNFTRPQPNTAPDVPIQHVDVSPYGVNTFLQNEVEPSKRERQVQMIAEAGFRWIRQQFPWEDIEIHGRGDFDDRRNVDAVGVISAWDKYDNIVDLAEKYGLNIMARLDNPPAWTHANPDIGEKAPPDDVQDVVNYAVAVAERYKGRLYYYQIWNEPNIYPEWGNQAVNPEAYTDLLCRTYTALKAVDPAIVVISGPLSPTVSLSAENLNDFIFLQRMYDAGAGKCFDVMSAQGYGFYSGPTDRRLRPMTLTYARHIYIRDIMVANGDAHKPIWISEAAWNAQPEDPTIVQIQYGNFGIVSEEQAARYMPLAYQRAQAEWPWVGVIFYWFFKQEDDSRRNQASYYFRMVEPDFTPLPVYESMKAYITRQPGTNAK